MKRKYNIEVYSPGGNITALVTPFTRDPLVKKRINNQLMKTYPTLEQVGFVRSSKDGYQLEMAGGEFCGNTTRTAAYYFLKAKTGNINIQVSGTAQSLRAGVNKKNTAYTFIPIPKQPTEIKSRGQYTIVPLEGITQIIVEKKSAMQTAKGKNLKQIGYTILKELDLLERIPAAGVIFTSYRKKQIFIEPVVWVRDIQTLFVETACASGTTAIGLLIAKRKQSSIELPVIQPSQSTLISTVTYQNNQFKKASIAGPIQCLLKGSLTL